MPFEMTTQRLTAAMIAILVVYWLAVAHSWSIQAIMPEYQEPDLVEDYTPTPSNWRQHRYDMQMNDLKKQAAEQRYEDGKAFVNKGFFRRGTYWAWFLPLFIVGAGVIVAGVVKLRPVWQQERVLMAAKYALLVWLAFTMWPDPFQIHSPLLATVLFLFLASDGFGVDPLSRKIQRRVAELQHLKAEAMKYEPGILAVVVMVLVGIQVSLLWRHYLPELPAEGFGGWWVKENLWPYVQVHVERFARGLLVVVVSLATVRPHYLSYELANLAKTINDSEQDKKTE